MINLIPKEEKFFEMFIEMAENIREGAILLEKMLGRKRAAVISPIR